MGDKSERHTPDAPMPAAPGEGGQDLAGKPGDVPSRPDGAVLEGDEQDDGDGGEASSTPASG